jgi:hypothetical protein
MVLKRIEPGSAFRVAGAIDGALGLVFGVIIACFSLFGAAFAAAAHNSAGFLGLFFGVGAVIFIPIFYGLMGAVMAALMEWVYNSLVSFTGGLKVHVA